MGRKAREKKVRRNSDVDPPPVARQSRAPQLRRLGRQEQLPAAVATGVVAIALAAGLVPAAVGMVFLVFIGVGHLLQRTQPAPDSVGDSLWQLLVGASVFVLVVVAVLLAILVFALCTAGPGTPMP